MKRSIIAVIMAMTLLTAMGGTALADHDHNLITPGTTVVDIANGNTENCSGDPAYHKFHLNIHLGTPGDFAFGQPNNPVSIIKTENATC